jgi:hypothetical protein
MWTLAKDGHTVVCELVNHPTRRGEVRCLIDGELQPETRAENDPLVLLALADEWKAGFKGKGWCDCACHQGATIIHVVPCCESRSTVTH